MKKFHEGKMYKWEVLFLLWMAYLLNQGDRQVFNTVLPAIRDALNLTDTSVGLIATIFNLAFAVVVPIGGWMGDRFSRKFVVTFSVLFFSVATMFTGYANSFVMLILLRSIATGGGEALFGPSNYSILAQYHTDTRARAMSIHQTAYYVGVILAGWLAGLIADKLGWQYSFLIFGGVGVLYNPQIQISAESGTKRSIFRQKNKTKRSKNRLHTTLIKPEQKVNEDLCSGFVLS